MLVSDGPCGPKYSPNIATPTLEQLTKDNAELVEEVKQLRTTVHMYRELAKWNHRSEASRNA
jgi:hypothetical protein